MGYIIGRQVPSHCSKSSRWAAQVCPSAVAHRPIASWARYLLQRLVLLSVCSLYHSGPVDLMFPIEDRAKGGRTA